MALDEPSALEDGGTLTIGRSWLRYPREDDPGAGIDQETYDNLVLYSKYASAAYQPLCPRPMGNTLIGQFTSVVTTTHGFVARDDRRKEIVATFRGSKEIISILIGARHGSGPATLADLARPHVHTGFLIAYQSIARVMLNIVESQIKSYPMYAVVMTGVLGSHSNIQGAIASIASIAIKDTYPATTVRLYTIGQPRTGDPAYAALVEKMVGMENIYRVPTNCIRLHSATEYWQFTELPAPEHVKRCRGSEDPEGSQSIPSSGVNPAHWIYFGQPIASDPSVCF
ncbi:Alpha/Beta hydrolase protein [Pisolithus albus]|nr:Alpha/Beta hydrolase protein [Pisolithus albus]